MNYYDNDYLYHQQNGSKNINAPKGKHIMNKNEAKLCRKLMSETGLSEEELREHKTYRIQLSVAQKEGEQRIRSRQEKYKRSVMKEVTKELKLAKEHPDCLALYKEKMETRKPIWGWGRWWMHDISTKWDLK